MALQGISCVVCRRIKYVQSLRYLAEMGWRDNALCGREPGGWVCDDCIEGGEGALPGENPGWLDQQIMISQAEDLETCAKFLTLANCLAETGRISTKLWLLAMQASVRIETAVATPDLENWGGCDDQQIADPETCEAL